MLSRQARTQNSHRKKSRDNHPPTYNLSKTGEKGINSIDSSLLLLGIQLVEHSLTPRRSSNLGQTETAPANPALGTAQPYLHAETGARSRPVFFIFIFQAIYELYRGEQDLIEDLQLARKV